MNWRLLSGMYFSGTKYILQSENENKKPSSLNLRKDSKDEGLSFRVTTLFAVKYDLSVLSLWADAYNNKLLNNGRIPVTLTMKIQCTARRG